MSKVIISVWQLLFRISFTSPKLFRLLLAEPWVVCDLSSVFSHWQHNPSSFLRSSHTDLLDLSFAECSTIWRNSPMHSPCPISVNSTKVSCLCASSVIITPGSLYFFFIALSTLCHYKFVCMIIALLCPSLPNRQLAPWGRWWLLLSANLIGLSGAQIFGEMLLWAFLWGCFRWD